MLQNRGYVVVQDAIDMTTEEFRNKFGESPARGKAIVFPARLALYILHIYPWHRGVDNFSREGGRPNRSVVCLFS